MNPWKCLEHYLGFREVQTKTIMRYHTFPPEWLKLKHLRISNAGEDMKLELPYAADGNAKME